MPQIDLTMNYVAVFILPITYTLGRYGNNAPRLKGKGVYTIWQYTETARIDGIRKPVDKARFNPQNSISDILYKSETAL